MLQEYLEMLWRICAGRKHPQHGQGLVDAGGNIRESVKQWTNDLGALVPSAISTWIEADAWEPEDLVGVVADALPTWLSESLKQGLGSDDVRSWLNHGILSAAIVGSALDASYDADDDDALRAALSAVAFSHVQIAKIEKAGLIGGDAIKLTEQPILWILRLCDALHTWGRVVCAEDGIQADIEYLRLDGLSWPISSDPVITGGLSATAHCAADAVLTDLHWDAGKWEAGLSKDLLALELPESLRLEPGKRFLPFRVEPPLGVSQA